MKIIDSHCHAWETWPYSSDVPDPESRGVVEQLLYEMDLNDVNEAVIVSAQIRHNPENNAYGAAQVEAYPDRLHQFVDLDSFWSQTYHPARENDSTLLRISGQSKDLRITWTPRTTAVGCALGKGKICFRLLQI